jgi:hypothetical protein
MESYGPSLDLMDIEKICPDNNGMFIMSKYDPIDKD